MSVIASYGNLALVNTGKQGVLKKLDNGYYEILLGAVGAIGNGGWVYDEKGCIDYLKNNPEFLGRLAAGQLKSEWGHPVRTPGMNDAMWMARVHTVLESNTCAHIRKIDFTYNTVRDKTGRFVVGIIGEVCPWGKQAGTFKDMLENPHGDVNFSVRSFTDNNARLGRKIFINVINWDHVTFPGIRETTKYNTPSMESEGVVSQLLDQAEFDLTNARIEMLQAKVDSTVSLESCDDLLRSIESMESESKRLARILMPANKIAVPTTILNW